LSFTVAVNEVVPTAVAAPLIKPVEPFSTNPAGSAPDVMDQAYGGLPPEAPKVAEYGWLTAPAGRVAGVVMVNAPPAPVISFRVNVWPPIVKAPLRAAPESAAAL
jgi:hypothetical protein